MNRNRKNGLLVKIICFFILFGSSIVEAKDKSTNSSSDKMIRQGSSVSRLHEGKSPQPILQARLKRKTLVRVHSPSVIL